MTTAGLGRVRGTASGRDLASRRVRTLTAAAGVGTVAATAILTAALVPSAETSVAGERATTVTTETGTSDIDDSSGTATTPQLTSQRPAASSGGS